MLDAQRVSGRTSTGTNAFKRKHGERAGHCALQPVAAGAKQANQEKQADSGICAEKREVDFLGACVEASKLSSYRFVLVDDEFRSVVPDV